MTTTEPRGTLRSLAAAPLDPWTYRTVAYLLLAFPVGLAYLLVLSVGTAFTVGLGVTLLGPVALAVTLLAVVSLAWLDAKLTGGLLGVDLSPGFPDTDRGFVAFTKELLTGRATWVGALFLGWRVLLGFVALFVLTVGVSLAAGLLAAPLAYGDYLVVEYGLGAYTIDTLGKSIAAAGLGALVAVAVLYLSNLLGHVAARVAVELLNDADRAAGSADA